MARADRRIVSLALAGYVSFSGCASPFFWNAESPMSQASVAGAEAPRLLDAPVEPRILRVSGVQEEGDVGAGSTLAWEVEDEPAPATAARKSVAFAEPAKPASPRAPKPQTATAPAPAPKPAVDAAAPLVRFVEMSESPTQNCKSCGAAAPAAKPQAITTAKPQAITTAKPQAITNAKPQAITTVKPQPSHVVKPQTPHVTQLPRPGVAPVVGSPPRRAPSPAPHSIASRGLLRVGNEPRSDGASESHDLPGTLVERPTANHRPQHPSASPNRPQTVRSGRRTLWDTLQGIGASHPLAAERRPATHPDHPANHTRTSHRSEGILSRILQ